MSLLNPCMKVPSIDFIQKMSQAPSKCLSEKINWIISRIPHRISKFLFIYGFYEFLAILEVKIREAPFLKVQSDKITV